VALETSASDAFTTIQEKFNEIGEGITTSAQELVEAVAAVGEEAVTDCEEMNDRFGDIIDKCGDVVAIIQEMMPTLENVQETLG
jgi:methyl-accepting chemotaxis protein